MYILISDDFSKMLPKIFKSPQRAFSKVMQYFEVIFISEGVPMSVKEDWSSKVSVAASCKTHFGFWI